MSTLNIVIKGIALIVEKDGMWKVYLPFTVPGCHRARLRLEGEVGPGISLAHPGQKLSVTGNNIDRPKHGSNFNQIFDITNSEAHGDEVRLKFDWQRSNEASKLI
jgi:hypothetical protein